MPLTTSEERKSENLGLAVFKSDKLVGELTALDSVIHLILTNKFESTIITIDNPFKENNTLDFSLYNYNSTKINVDIVNGSPLISSNIKLGARLLSSDSDSDYLNKDNVKILENLINSYIERNVLMYQYKTAKILNSDIDGTGKYLVKKFFTKQKWDDYNWSENYKNAFFDVNVSTILESSFLLSS